MVKRGPMRRIKPEVLDELKRIFEVTGGMDLFEAIESASEKKAKEMGLEFKKEGIDFEYFKHVFTTNSDIHFVEEPIEEHYETGR